MSFEMSMRDISENGHSAKCSPLRQNQRRWRLARSSLTSHSARRARM